jgi:broad specificity phosphatase PhoE
VSLLLLRHVHAGDRGAFDGDDRRRPVSTTGLRQALALVAAYRERPVVAVVSSPYTRCVQSVEPLAAARGLVVEEADELAEGTPFDVVDRFLRSQQRRGERDDGDVVACSHGDVIGGFVTSLQAGGVALDVDPPRWEKASTWVLTGGLDGPDTAYLPPPG